MQHDNVANLCRVLRSVRPFLVVAFTVPALIMLFFIVAVVMCAVDLTKNSVSADNARNVLPDYYCIGMGSAIVVFEIFPMLVYHDLLVKMSSLLSAYQTGVTRARHQYVGSEDVLTVYDFLRENLNRENLQMAVFTQGKLLPRPPPPYNRVDAFVDQMDIPESPPEILEEGTTEQDVPTEIVAQQGVKCPKELDEVALNAEEGEDHPPSYSSVSVPDSTTSCHNNSVTENNIRGHI